MAVVNSWLLYQRDAVKLKISKSKQMGLSEFKTQIAFSLMKSGKEIFKKRGRPSFGSVEVEYKKKKRTGNASAAIPQKIFAWIKLDIFPLVQTSK